MKQKRLMSWKLLLTIVLVVALCVAVFAVTGVFASLSDTTGVVTVREGSVRCEVNKDYSVTNTGTVPVLIRAKVVVNWLDEEGHILGTTPKNAEVNIGLPSQWSHFYNGSNAVENGYWFFNGIVEPGQKVSFLNGINASGGQVKVTVLAEAIQASPEEAAAETWGMIYRSGSWSQK